MVENSNVEHVRDLIKEIDYLYFEQEVWQEVPFELRDEFENIMDGMRVKYNFLGIGNPENQDIVILEAVVKKLKDLKSDKHGEQTSNL